MRTSKMFTLGAGLLAAFYFPTQAAQQIPPPNCHYLIHLDTQSIEGSLTVIES